VAKTGVRVFEVGVPVVKTGVRVFEAGVPVVKTGVRVFEAGLPVVKTGVRVFETGVPVAKTGVRVFEAGARVAKTRVRVFETGIRGSVCSPGKRSAPWRCHRCGNPGALRLPGLRRLANRARECIREATLAVARVPAPPCDNPQSAAPVAVGSGFRCSRPRRGLRVAPGKGRDPK